MYIRELNKQSLNELMESNHWIVLTIYKLNDILSDLLLATINSVNKNINETIIVANIEKEEFSKYVNDNTPFKIPAQLPEIWILKNKALYERIPGFCRVGKIVEIIRENIS